jgi:hypothetical protein
MGDAFLLHEVRRVRPAVHVFGHIHAGRTDWFGRVRGGQEVVRWDLAERHLEAVLARESPEGLGGFVVSLLNLVAWYHLVGFWFYSWRALVWEWLFWRDEPPSTRMVNAALMREDEGWLGNDVQVIHL